MNKVGVGVKIDGICTFSHSVLVSLPLFEMDKAEVDVTISKVLNYKPVVMWSWWKDVGCSDDAVNKAKFKTSLLWSLKLNVASEFVPRLSGKGLDNCHPNCLTVHRDREESTHLSKEET